MEDMNLGDFLKKAMEEEMQVDEQKEKQDISEDEEYTKRTINVMASMKMISLGRAAIDEKVKILNALLDELNNMDKNDTARWSANASVKIQSAAKKLTALDTIISGMMIASLKPGNEMNDAIKSIIRVNIM